MDFDKEMEAALIADGEKLRELTGQDHGPWTWTGEPESHGINADDARDKIGGATLEGVNVADLRIVAMDWVDGAPTEHMVLESQLDLFIEACKRLHFNPGINPANGVECARIWRLRVSELRAHGPYWWACPSLDSGNEGAFTISAGVSKTVWMDPDHDVLA